MSYERELTIAIACLVQVGFNAIIHGLNHTRHNFLATLWKDESAERSSQPKIFSKIGWHILADILSGLLICVLLLTVNSNEVWSLARINLLITVLMTSVWLHIYSAFEIKFKTILVLAGLGFIQSTITGLIVIMLKLSL